MVLHGDSTKSEPTIIAREATTHDVVPTEEYMLHRILLGIPEGVQDIVPMQAFPMESNLDIMGARMYLHYFLPSTLTKVPQWTSEKVAMLGKNSLSARIILVSFGSEFFL